jgi:ribosome-interacting GTPase 1
VISRHGWNLEELLETIWEYTKMIRIYTKVPTRCCALSSCDFLTLCPPPPCCRQPKGQVPDYTAPVVLHDQQPSIEDFCNKLHKQLVSQLKYAWVWGSSVRHQPQKVSGVLALYVYGLWPEIAFLHVFVLRRLSA